ncbi:MAG: transposase [Chloroflexi bacterium]|nr:transposase [Chloroflexota bacterium]
MKLVAQVKLQPTPAQAEALHRTLTTANAAANYISTRAWQTKTFRRYDLHHACYHDVRAQFDLAAQMTVRLLAKVADAYKVDRHCQRRFKPQGSIAYDSRILSWQLAEQIVSLWTLAGRQPIPFVCGEPQMTLLQSLRGEADLVYRDGAWYLYQTCEVAEPPVGDPTEFLGVDLGIVNIATDSDGTVHAGGQVNGLRRRHRRLRRKLQQKGTKSAKRLLKKRRRKERRFARQTNHVISKQLVARAERTGRGIALEDLTGLRERVRVSKAHRSQLHSWAFYDLRCKIEYKARRAGVRVVVVDPANTSRTCPACGSIDARNWPNQATFCCVSCGYCGFADHVAAGNIARRAAVNQPHVSAPTG